MSRRQVRIAAIGAALALAALGLAGCQSQAATVSHNLSQEADSFKIERDVIFYNGITDKYILEVKGLCSVNATSIAKQAAVTCKIGADKYVKDFIGLSDNITYLVNQTTPSKSDPFAYKIIVKPTLPDFDIQTR